MIVLRKGCLPIEKKEVNVDIKTRMHHNNNSGYSAALRIKRYKLLCTKKNLQLCCTAQGIQPILYNNSKWSKTIKIMNHLVYQRLVYYCKSTILQFKKRIFCSFQFGPIFFLDKVFSFRFTTKLRGRYRDFPYIPSSHTWMACPITSIIHQNDMLVTKNGHTLTHQNNPESIICHRFHSWCLTCHKFGQICNGMHPS